MKGYAVITRRRQGEKLEIAEESEIAWVAENHAQELYRDRGLDMVMVCEVQTPYTAESGLRYHTVLKIERRCKHPNIQAEFFLMDGIWRCVECGLVFPDDQNLFSNIEISLEPTAQEA